MAKAEPGTDSLPDVLTARQVRDYARAIITGGLDRADAGQHNFIAAVLHQALDPELSPDLLSE